MKPDDFMKRGFLLPEGCKDLTDASKINPHGSSKSLSPSEWTDVMRRLIEEYTSRLADPNLSASAREKIEKNLKELRKQIGDAG